MPEPGLFRILNCTFASTLIALRHFVNFLLEPYLLSTSSPAQPCKDTAPHVRKTGKRNVSLWLEDLQFLVGNMRGRLHRREHLRSICSCISFYLTGWHAGPHFSRHCTKGSLHLPQRHIPPRPFTTEDSPQCWWRGPSSRSHLQDSEQHVGI